MKYICLLDVDIKLSTQNRGLSTSKTAFFVRCRSFFHEIYHTSSGAFRLYVARDHERPEVAKLLAGHRLVDGRVEPFVGLRGIEPLGILVVRLGGSEEYVEGLGLSRQPHEGDVALGESLLVVLRRQPADC